ncbi:MAG: CcdB family protein [Pseudomonadota bacterium]
MAQFDVYRNPVAASREAIPYLVDVQSDLLSGMPTRLTFPLGDPAVLPSAGPAALCPTVQVNGQLLRVLPHLAAAFRAKDLGKSVASLAGQASEFVGAMDAVLSGV